MSFDNFAKQGLSFFNKVKNQAVHKFEDIRNSGATSSTKEYTAVAVSSEASSELPWLTLPETHQPIARFKVEKLLKMPETFEMPAPPNYDFEFDNRYVIIAQKLLAEFPSLQKLRYSLVPRVIKEENFWKNCFWQMEELIEGIRDMPLEELPEPPVSFSAGPEADTRAHMWDDKHGGEMTEGDHELLAQMTAAMQDEVETEDSKDNKKDSKKDSKDSKGKEEIVTDKKDETVKPEKEKAEKETKEWVCVNEENLLEIEGINIDQLTADVSHVELDDADMADFEKEWFGDTS
eukprot:Platyproteum_vivax@DN3384_c0_g1_i1.p1